MRNLKTKLIVLLVCQLVLAAGLWGLAHQRKSAHSATKQLLSFDRDKVDKIIVGRGKDKVELVKSSDDWKMPEFHDLIADKKKVESLLKDLGELESSEPVTRTASSHQRFELSNDNPTASVELKSGENRVALVRIGKSPAFGKQHVRLNDSNDVYQVRWGAHEVQGQGKSWFDRSLLSVGAVKEIKLPEFALQKNGELWTSDDTDLNQQKVKELVAQLENLQVFDVEESDVEPDFQVELVKQDDTPVSLFFAHRGDDHFVRAKDEGLLFKLPKATAEKLRQAKLEELVEEKPEASPTPGE